jgi:serine/threonine protein kinase/Tfp pilus assembly protein PilF
MFTSLTYTDGCDISLDMLKDPEDAELLRVALSRGLLTRQQVKECLTDKADSQDITDVILKKGLLSPSDLEILVELCRRLGQEKGRRFGRYEIMDELGRGASGTIFKAFDPDLKRIIAIKQLSKAYTKDEESRKRFIQEARVIANLRHPNILSVHELGIVDGDYYFTMDYIEAKSLREIMHERGYSISKGVRIIKDIAAAVQHAHEQGVIHRDIKPDNILVDTSGNTYLTDFGLAYIPEAEHLTQPGVILGTVPYMAPEQARGRTGKIGPQTDVYCLGATLYELVTRRPPFQGKTPADIILKVIQKEPLRPRKINPAIHPDLETIILKCLEKEPSNRYHTPKELANELTRYLAGEPIQARAQGTLKRGLRWARKHKLLIGAALVFIIITASLIWTLLSLKDIEEELAKESEVNHLLIRINDRLHDLRGKIRKGASSKDIERIGAKAIQDLNTVIRLRPKLGIAYLLKGEVCYHLKRVGEAVRDFTKAITLSETPAIAYLWRARAYLLDYYLKRGIPQLKLGFAPRLLVKPETPSEREARVHAERDLERLVKLSPRWTGNEEHRWAEGVLLLLRGRLKQAEQIFHQTIDIFPHAGDTHFYLGIIYYLQMRFDQAEAEFNKALESGRDVISVQISLGMLYLAKGVQEALNGIDPTRSYQSGLDALKIVLDMQPSNSKVLRLKVVIYLYLSRWVKGKETVRYLRLAREGCKDLLLRADAQVYTLSGIVEFELGRALGVSDFYKEALTYFSHAEKLIQDPSLYFNKAQCLLAWCTHQWEGGKTAGKRFKEALDNIAKAIAMEEDPAYYNARGTFYLQYVNLYLWGRADPLDTIQKAITDFKDALKLNPNFYPALTNLATAYYFLGMQLHSKDKDPTRAYNLALKNIKKSIKLNPHAWVAYHTLALIYTGKIRYRITKGKEIDKNGIKKAFEAFKTAILKGPNRAEPYAERGHLYLLLGDNQKALKDYQEAVRLNPTLKRDLDPHMDRARTQNGDK